MAASSRPQLRRSNRLLRLVAWAIPILFVLLIAGYFVAKSAIDAYLRSDRFRRVWARHDIEAAAFHNPSLTTIRQPLHQMGALAVRTLLQQLRPSGNRELTQIAVEPELIVRESTGPVRRK